MHMQGAFFAVVRGFFLTVLTIFMVVFSFSTNPVMADTIIALDGNEYTISLESVNPYESYERLQNQPWFSGNERLAKSAAQQVADSLGTPNQLGSYDLGCLFVFDVSTIDARYGRPFKTLFANFWDGQRARVGGTAFERDLSSYTYCFVN